MMTLVEAIIANLQDRRGFDAAFDIDDEVMDELKQDLSDLINSHLTSREAKGEPDAYLHTVVQEQGGEEDLALSFAPDNFPLGDELGWKSIGYVPLYAHPAAQKADKYPASDYLRDQVGARMAHIVGVVTGKEAAKPIYPSVNMDVCNGRTVDIVEAMDLLSSRQDPDDFDICGNPTYPNYGKNHD